MPSRPKYYEEHVEGGRLSGSAVSGSSSESPGTARASDTGAVSQRQTSARVMSAIALAVAVSTVALVIVLRMCASPDTTSSPDDCERGMSAYEVWLSLGNSGSVEDFLADLVGETGAAGTAGQRAYELWLTQPGNAGRSEVEFLESLIGPIGPQGSCTAGSVGARGPAGQDGATGLSAFEVWLMQHPGGTMSEFLSSLIGPQGQAGIQGSTGPTGPQGPAGGFGAFGSFYHDTDVALPVASPIPVPLNTTSFASGVAVVDEFKISLATAGKYNISFSSQLRNDAGQRRTVTIWLSKNGVDVTNWLAETSTDVILGTTVLDEKNAAAWNFFVDAQAGDYFTLMIVSNGDRMFLDGGSSLNTTPVGIPQIPSTILTVNQVG